MNQRLRIFQKLPASWWRALALTTAVGLLLLGAIACRSVNTTTRAVVQLPEVPGASYIGSKECEQCHPKICQDFTTADHRRLIALGKNSMNAGCESCHGPCSLHSESGGETKPPYIFTAGRPTKSSFGARTPLSPNRATETVCFTCHTDVRGQFNLPSHHPVPEGNLTCAACHNPHKGSIMIGGGTSLLSENDSCNRCHSEQRGPYAFEHEALHEGCSICHTPHGSVNSKLLTARDANLCLKCHFQQVNGSKLFIGGSDHTTRVQQGTCWTAGCHEAVHGSRVSSSLRF